MNWFGRSNVIGNSPMRDSAISAMVTLLQKRDC